MLLIDINYYKKPKSKIEEDDNEDDNNDNDMDLINK